MAHTYKMDEVTTILKQFVENPFDAENQIKFVDMTRRSPLAVGLLLAEGGSFALVSTLPKYVTLRKVNDGVIRYDKKTIRARLKELEDEAPDSDENEGESSELDTVDAAEKKEPVAAGVGRGRKKKTPETIPTTINIDEIFEDDAE